MPFKKLKELNSGSGSTLGDYKFLYGFISLVKPRRILDIGTHYGLSAIAMAMALRDSGLDESKILTIDINEGFLEMARTQIQGLGLSDFIETRCCTSSDIGDAEPFDVVFIDGVHTLEGCLTDFNNVKKTATYVLIHDAAQLKETSNAVKTISDMGHDVLNIDVGNEGEQWSFGEVVYRAYPGIAIVKVR